MAYYLGIVAEGVEGQGRWVGSGSADLELGGPVERDHLAAVLGGAHPFTGATLHVRPVRVPGVELTFQVPKSVSVLWAVAGHEAAREIDTGRAAALDAAVSYLQDEALVVGPNGRQAGMVGAAFAHRTSRGGDPHLHAHVLLANLGHAPGTGGWMAVNRLVLNKHVHTAGYLFEAHLRRELSDRLGVRFGPVRAGVAQVEGVPEAVCRRFSRRRLQVEAVMAAHGASSPAAARLAALIERPDRHAGLAAELLAPEWQVRAADAGFGPDAARAVLGRGRDGQEADSRRPIEEALGLEGLSSFSRRDVLRGVCAAYPDGIAAPTARRSVDEVLGSAGIVRLTGRSPLRREDVVRTERGGIVVVPTDRDRWTTRAELEAGRRAAALAVELRGQGRVALDADDLDRLLTREPALGPAERKVVRGLARSADGVQVLDAAAGPERDRVLAASRRVWSSQGVRVVGAGSDGAAVQRLEAATGIECSDLDGVVGRLAHLAAPVVTPTVLVVDRAVDLPTSEVVRVLETAGRAGVGVVLVGDPGRIPEVDRAAGWRAVTDALGSLHLERGARERDAPLERSVNDPVYRVGDRLALSESPTVLRDRLVADWREAWDGSPRSVMVSTARVDVDDLNRRARDVLLQDGALDGHRIAIGGLEVRGGDSLVVARLDGAARRFGWRAGQAWRIVPGAGALAGPDGSVRELQHASGVQFRWGYAATPYEARQVGAADWLVLGAPDTPSSGSARERARYYVVAGVEAGAGLAATLARQDAFRDLISARAHAAELDPPPYLLAALGPRPRSPEDRHTWRAAAGAVEAYRERWGINDGRDPLGAEPARERGVTGPDDRRTLQRAERQEAVRLLRSAAVRLGRSLDRGRELGRELGRETGRESGRDPALGRSR